MDTGTPETLPPPRTPGPTGSGRPTSELPEARSALAISANWEEALPAALDQLGDIEPDLLLVYTSAAYNEHLPDIVQRAWRQSGAMLMAGCSTTGVIANGLEAEHQPAISMLALSLPGSVLRPVRFTQSMIELAGEPQDFRQRLGVDLHDLSGWLILADPFRLDASMLIDRLNDAYPGVPMIGGLACPAEHQRRTWVFLNGETYGDGGIGLAIGGRYDLLPVVSQGCEPIGESWTITGTSDQWVESISNRPALSVLAETLAILPNDMQEEAERNLAVGLAANEYRDRFGRGDFLIRNITSIDWKRGALAVAARPRVGQTIQFHLRDAATAALDLTLMLTESQNWLEGRNPVASVLFSCNGRGVAMFGAPDHDAGELAKWFDGIPHAGMVAAGEIGPVGKRSFLHGFTASMGIILDKAVEPVITEIPPGTTPG